MSELFRGVVSIAPTKRRRYWWVAWWKAPPSADPFRPPDGFDGGARTPEEARRSAERAAGTTLSEIEASWARAWLRVREGKSPWPKRREESAGRPSPRTERVPSAREVLGVGKSATEDEIKRAFRARALELHPDRGGDPAVFIRMKKAYESLQRRRRSPR